MIWRVKTAKMLLLTLLWHLQIPGTKKHFKQLPLFISSDFVITDLTPKQRIKLNIQFIPKRSKFDCNVFVKISILTQNKVHNKNMCTKNSFVFSFHVWTISTFKFICSYTTMYTDTYRKTVSSICTTKIPRKFKAVTVKNKAKKTKNTNF